MTWKRMTGGLGTLLCVALTIGPSLSAGAGPAQDGVQEPEDERTETEKRRDTQIERLMRKREEFRAARDARCVQLLRDMQGGWQLIEFRSPVLHDAGRLEVGFLVVSGEFLSIEVHMAYFDQAGNEQQSFIQTGTYRLNFNQQGELTAMRLIGTIKSNEGYVIPQFPGEISVYEIEFNKGALLLTSKDSTRFTFERIATGNLTKLLYREVDWLPGEEDRAVRRAAQASARKEAPAEVESGSDQ